MKVNAVNMIIAIMMLSSSSYCQYLNWHILNDTQHHVLTSGTSSFDVSISTTTPTGETGWLDTNMYYLLEVTSDYSTTDSKDFTVLILRADMLVINPHNCHLFSRIARVDMIWCDLLISGQGAFMATRPGRVS